ncbi:fructose-bisphosphate aldolase class I [Candidatus Woesebacteria bacterium]|nr:MAG: fructose-bisphosphate aldolase class I [Candidatus Woesebacteria bacterium]
MDKKILNAVAKKLVADGKGILASDSSVGSMTRRLEKVGIESTKETRMAFRDIFITSEGLEDYITGVILFDETIREYSDGGDLFTKILLDKGVMPGIKVDKKAWPMANFPGEMLAEGLDGLRDRLIEYKNMGATFAKWRAVITIGEGIPTDTCINSNAESLARYAALCQEVDIVPVVEPEVVMDGSHDMERCESVTYSTLKKVFTKLTEHRIYLGGMILKPNMILPGKDSKQKIEDDKVAEATFRVLNEVVPDEVPGVVFLSGGQSADDATRRLNLIAQRSVEAPWEVSFSFERALQEDALNAWEGKKENVEKAKAEFIKRAKKVCSARKGEL